MIRKSFMRLLIASGMPLISLCGGIADEPSAPPCVVYVAPWGNDGWSGKEPRLMPRRLMAHCPPCSAPAR